jgi:hypothetical protein
MFMTDTKLLKHSMSSTNKPKSKPRPAPWPTGPYWWARLTPAQRRELAAMGRAFLKQLDKHEHR